MALNRKQKILIPLIILAFIYVVWQLYDLFGSNTAPTKTPTPNASTSMMSTASMPAPATQNKLATTPNFAMPNTSSMQNSTTSPAQSANNMNGVQNQPATLSTSFAAMAANQPVISPEQAEYLRLVNQYQTVKMQRMIFDEQAAIASAKEKIAQINAKLGVSANTSSDIDTGSNATGYKLVYIDYQDDRWTATLNKMGQYFEVNPGAVLADGTQIIRINQQGVTLQQGSSRMFLNFFGASPAPAQQQRSSNKSANIPAMRTSTSTPPLAATVSTNNNSKLHNPAMMPEKPMLPVQQTKPIVITPSAPVQQSISVKPLAPKTSVATNTVAPVQKSTTVNISEKNITSFAPVTAAPAPTANKLVPATTNAGGNKEKLVANAATVTLPKKEEATTTTTSSEVKLTPSQAKTYAKLQAMLPTHATNPTSSSSKQSKSTPTADTSAEQALLKLPSQNYMLQLMSNNSRDILTRFVKANKLQDTYIYQTFHMGKPWFVLVYGNYKTVAEAQTAIKSLPKAVRANKPWVRDIKSIQSDVNITLANQNKVN